MSPFRIMFAAIWIAFCVLTAATHAAAAQEQGAAAANLETQRTQLEIQKLEAQVRALAKQPLPKGVDYAWHIAMTTGGLSFVISLWTAHRQRRGPADLKVHDERIKQYQAIITSTAPLAI